MKGTNIEDTTGDYLSLSVMGGAHEYLWLEFWPGPKRADETVEVIELDKESALALRNELNKFLETFDHAN